MKTPHKSIFCNPKFRWIAMIAGLITAISVSSHSKAETFEGMDVKVAGKGSPVIFFTRAQ